MASTTSFSKMKWHVQVLSVAGICAVALGVFWYTFLSPISTDNDVKAATVSDLQLKVEKNLALKARYEQFKKESEVLEVRLDELKRILPQDKEIEHILSQVQVSAREAGLRIQQGISKPVIDRDAYTEWPMEMQVLGTYHNLGAFLEKIRELPRIVNVSKLKVDSRPGSGDNPYTTTIAASYEATTFVYREIADSAPAAQTVKAAK